MALRWNCRSHQSPGRQALCEGRDHILWRSVSVVSGSTLVSFIWSLKVSVADSLLYRDYGCWAYFKAAPGRRTGPTRVEGWS